MRQIKKLGDRNGQWMLELNNRPEQRCWPKQMESVPLLRLKNRLNRELDLSRGRGCSGQQAQGWVWAARPIKNVGVSRTWGRSEVGVIDNVKELRSELEVEGFGDTLDVIVLE